MNRRWFFGRLIGAALAPVVAKFVPAPVVKAVVSPPISFTPIYSQEFIRVSNFEERFFRPGLVELVNQMDREMLMGDRWNITQHGRKIGDTISIRKPKPYVFNKIA